MELNVDFTFNAVTTVTQALGWGVIAFLAYRIFKKLEPKPNIWKIIIVVFVGLISFSMNWNMFHTMIKFPILPLGVWLLYFVLKGKDKRWQRYRTFAWLGFWGNFILLAATLLAIPIDQVFYPKDEPATYISNLEDASVINSHPSAKEHVSLNAEGLLNQLDTMRQETIDSDQLYENTYIHSESNRKQERFPYQLIGTSSDWGSGISAIIFIEDDGKGLLIATPKHQLYFRSEASLIEGVE